MPQGCSEDSVRVWPRCCTGVSVSDFLDRLGPVPRRVRSFRKFLFLREEVLFAAAIEERDGAGSWERGGSLLRPWSSPPSPPGPVPAERARGAHQIVCPLGACNGLTPVPSPPQPHQWLLLGMEPAAVVAWPARLVTHGLQVSPLEAGRRLTGPLPCSGET